ncbi:MAG: prolipoprotein diacylglyceryl transferase [Bacteroidetes bacterium]|nr:prolipoprotein diacylglyceryl transferase [Bacteroidota bacterium]
MLNFILWDVDPEIFSIGPFSIRWYGLLFALVFIIGLQIISKIFKDEGKPKKDVDTITIYMFFATLIGARLGHCLFYEPGYFLKNPIEILQIWHGGLASHGAAVGIFIGLYLYSRKKPDQSYLWTLDRVAIVVALAGCLIRLGNLMNSEIIGIQTDLPWGFIFVRLGEDFARHPAQLYESISCLLLFFLLYYIYNKAKAKTPQGKIFGLFLIMIFGLRFFYEFIKENQEGFEEGMVLNMGQILSIPLVITGVILLIRSYRNGK